MAVMSQSHLSRISGARSLPTVSKQSTMWLLPTLHRRRALFPNLHDHHSYYSHHAIQLSPLNVSRTVPYDVWCAVVACLDFYTLSAISLVCRDLKYEASKYLWRSCTLHVHPRLDGLWGRQHLEEGCRIIMSDGRASRVRDMRIDIQGFLGGEDDPEVDRTFQHIFNALQRTTNLRSLTILSLHHRSRIARGLSSHTFGFALERFMTDMHCDEKLDGFWDAHPEIEHVELLSVEASIPRFLPHALPNLKRVRATLAQHTAIVRGSPVQSVCLEGFWEGECQMVTENLTMSSMPVEELSMQIFDNNITALPYTTIIASMPKLVSLRVVHGDILEREERAAALDALASLQSLESFEWAGGSPAGQAEIFGACSKRCRSLRNITFRWGNGNYFQRRFERESEDAGWGIVQR